MRNPINPVTDDAKIVMDNYQKEKAKKYGMEYIGTFLANSPIHTNRYQAI